jgi:hypothetical protein
LLPNAKLDRGPMTRATTSSRASAPDERGTANHRPFLRRRRSSPGLDRGESPDCAHPLGRGWAATRLARADKGQWRRSRTSRPLCV